MPAVPWFTLWTTLFAQSTTSFPAQSRRRISQPLPTFIVAKESQERIPVQAAYLHPQTASLSPQNSQVFALTCNGIAKLPSTSNFLATQVWPSARFAAMAIERYLPTFHCSTAVVCEFGCGPGLPSLAAAAAGAAKVFATDIDETALALVQEASSVQNLSHVIEASHFDLINCFMDEIPHADLYLFSDVFENAQVAEGAARLTAELLMRGRSKVWVFAQPDRSQRDTFLKNLRDYLQDDSLIWSAVDHSTLSLADDGLFRAPLQYCNSLWLSEVDESAVKYC